MAYLTQDLIAANPAMQRRVAQAYADEVGPDGGPYDPVTNRPYDPDRWTMNERRFWASAPGWDTAWDSALVGSPDDDPGVNEGVITDGMILSQVQSMLAPPPPPN